MNQRKPAFLNLYLGVVAASLLPVILTAFFWIPFTLGGHPGEERNVQNSAPMHMT